MRRVKINFFQPKEHFFLDFIQVIFRVFSVTFIIFFVVEYFLSGFVTSWFNPIWLLIIAIISGIILTLND